MKISQLLITTFVATQFAVASYAADDTSTNSTEAVKIEALKQEIQKLDQKVSDLEHQRDAEPSATPGPDKEQMDVLDQKVRVLERQRELDQQAATDTAKTQPKLSLGANGFSFGTGDSNFVVNLHGLIQLDSRSFIDDGGVQGNGGFLLRRARPILSGTVFHDFDFLFTPDFGGSTVQIVDAYLNYRNSPELQFQAGKFKSPVGLEQLQSDPYTSFNERSLVTDLVPNRDLGVDMHGDLFGSVASYAAGIFNGASDYNGTTSNTDFDDNRAFAGRLFFQPWKKSDTHALQGLGFGVGGSYENDRASAAGLSTGYKTDGQQNFFTYAAGVVADGEHWRISPQGYYYFGPFGLLGEYVISDQEISRTTAPIGSTDLQNTAWEVSAGWVLTGENASFNGVTPKNPFNPRSGEWGAWQIVARYSDLNIDDAAFPTFASVGSASEAKAWSLGLNWYLNRNIRVNASYSHTAFGDISGTPSPVTRQNENVLFTRIQLAF